MFSHPSERTSTPSLDSDISSFLNLSSEYSPSTFSPKTGDRNLYSFEKIELAGSPMSPSTNESEPRFDKRNQLKSESRQPDGWTTADDTLLWTVGTKYNNDWKKVAKRLMILTERSKLSPVFLRERYAKLKLEKAETREPFSLCEDLKLVGFIQEFGCDWLKISALFGNRGPVKLKNRYYTHILRKNLLENLLATLKENELNQLELAEQVETVDDFVGFNEIEDNLSMDKY